ncbi:uncharacterized protein LOC131215465 [Anopheles bellator]|uniref:uncharacterized protein LOC131215465 n=1 Tax=Anopheles bellator TaxID=139047 RepID=UPI00264A0D20|nr:uncharacterized protein LOC131215465 [Anopheles bellator]
MAGKASKDGVNFQQHLYYYLMGLCHNRRIDFSILYEGNDKLYGAFDDVILKTHDQKPALYFVQAKQAQSESKQISIEDLFDMKKGIAKYIGSYKTYLDSGKFTGDGIPDEIIYWTSMECYKTTIQTLMQPCDSILPHIGSLNDSIVKYRFKDWKMLLLLDIAWKWAKICNAKPELKLLKAEYICESVAYALSEELLQKVENTDKLKFRDEFLHGKPEFLSSVSSKARSFREHFKTACQLHQRKEQFDIKCFMAKQFDASAFGLVPSEGEGKVNADSVQFEYKGLKQENLEMFFNLFRYYTNVPKGEDMLKILNELYDRFFEENLFEKHLVSRQETNNKQESEHYIKQRDLNSVIKIIKLKRKLVAPSVTNVEFSDESLAELREKLQDHVKRQLNLEIVAPNVVDWTANRVEKELLKITTCIVVRKKDLIMLSDELNCLPKKLIDCELHTIVVLDVEQSDKPRVLDLLQRKGNQLILIFIFATSTFTDRSSVMFEDKLDIKNVKFNFKQFGDKNLVLDDIFIPVTDFLQQTALDSIEKLAQLYQLKKIDVKSDFYQPDEPIYVQRTLMDEDKNAVTYETIRCDKTTSVFIVSDTAGQGKTIEILRFGKYLSENNATCLFFRAKKLATEFSHENLKCFTGYRDLLKLLQISPMSQFTEDMVVQCLENRNQIHLLVDGFDEIIEASQDVVIKLLEKVVQFKLCTVLIATRTEAKLKLKKSFNDAKVYQLGEFSYETYFKKLWLSDSSRSSPVLEENVEFFLSNFDSVFKRTGCKLFLEVPQLCKIMGSIYEDRIKRPNFQLHNNYEIGSIYDTFIRSQFDHAVNRYFDSNLEIHVYAMKLMRVDFYKMHTNMAYETEYNSEVDIHQYKHFARFGLISFRSSNYAEFIHRSVLEYFMVRSFLFAPQNVKEKDFMLFLKRHFCVSRANIADKLIDFFLGGKEQISKSALDNIQCYLATNANRLSIYVRITLNNATFNTLKLLLRAAPTKTVRNLKFRFGGSQTQQTIPNDSTDINLKRLGERQMILLLNTLRDSSAEGYLMNNVIFEADPNEEDMIEVAIRKPFPEVFNWVVSFIKEHNSLERTQYIQNRIPRYARTIITHCYADNKERMIDNIIRFCKANLERNVVQGYLRSLDLLGEVISHIEVVPNGKTFVEDHRLDLVRKILSVLEYYFDGDDLPSLKIRQRENVEGLRNEAIKSLLRQWVNGDK